MNYVPFPLGPFHSPLSVKGSVPPSLRLQIALLIMAFALCYVAKDVKQS